MFKGSCAALVTPMTSTGEIDEATLVDLVEWHCKEGTAALVISGTTGESATLSPSEQLRLFSLAIKAAKKRLPIIAGTGTNSTAFTIEKTQAAKNLGVDACLVVTPYYNRPTQAGLVSHFSAVAKAVNIPIILYNVPTRTACDMLAPTVGALSEIPNIIGIKEATGNLQRLEELKQRCNSGFLFYSGDDPSACEFICQGGHGVISITSNIAPSQMQRMCQYALNKDFEKALALDKTLQALHRTMIIESNPIPVKWALHYLGKIANELRLPLTHLSEEHHAKIKQAIQTAGIYTQQFSF